MDELKQIQSEHLKSLLNDLADKGISAKSFANTVGVSEVTVSNWKHGRQKINPSNANEINKHFPDYSVQYLLGYDDFPNEDAAIKDRRKQSNARFFAELDCVEGLLKLNGVSFEYFSEHIEDAGAYTVTTEDGESFTMSDKHDEFIELTKNGYSVTLTMEQWRAFRSEIVGYANMRLTMLIERGVW